MTYLINHVYVWGVSKQQVVKGVAHGAALFSSLFI